MGLDEELEGHLLEPLRRHQGHRSATGSGTCVDLYSMDQHALTLQRMILCKVGSGFRPVTPRLRQSAPAVPDKPAVIPPVPALLDTDIRLRTTTLTETFFASKESDLEVVYGGELDCIRVHLPIVPALGERKNLVAHNDRKLSAQRAQTRAPMHQSNPAGLCGWEEPKVRMLPRKREYVVRPTRIPKLPPCWKVLNLSCE